MVDWAESTEQHNFARAAILFVLFFVFVLTSILPCAHLFIYLFCTRDVTLSSFKVASSMSKGRLMPEPMIGRVVLRV